jgi:hypothetical protein
MAEEYTEPTDEQLVSFLSVYLPSRMGLSPLGFASTELLKMMIEERIQDPAYKAQALKIHRRVSDEINEMSQKLEQGQLQCEYIRPNKKRCPNRNKPGSFFCGLHQGEEK